MGAGVLGALPPEEPEEPTGFELVPWVSPEEPSAPEIPGELSPQELTRRDLSGDGPPSATLADVFVFDDEQRRLLLLFEEVAVAAARFVAGTSLSGLTTDCRVDPTGVTGLQRLLELLTSSDWFQDRYTARERCCLSGGGYVTYSVSLPDITVPSFSTGHFGRVACPHGWSRPTMLAGHCGAYIESGETVSRVAS